MNRFMPRSTQKDLINLFLGKITKKRGRTGSRLDMPVQRGEPVRAALVHLSTYYFDIPENAPGVWGFNLGLVFKNFK